MRKILTLISLCLLSAILCFGQNSYSISVNVRVKGRSVVGAFPKPSMPDKRQGIVVVSVKVDQYGNVTEAVPGVEGTNTTDKALWESAQNASMKVHFNMDASAPALQTGIITFGFGEKNASTSNSISISIREEYTSLRDLVEEKLSGEVLIKAVFNDVHRYDRLIFLVEEDDYIIPVKLIKRDLGAEKRFRALDLHKGDTLIIKGKSSTIDVDFEEYKGLEEAMILDVIRGEGVSSAEQIEDETIPFQLVEQKPSFNGGDANEFSKWVNEHLVYPEEAKKNGIQGRVTMQFLVDVDGSIKNVSVLRGVERSLDAEAIRVISSSPKWKPGRSRGKDLPVTYTFPVIFKIQ